MGGVDKGLVELAGQPLVAWVAARVAPQVQRLVISANRNPERYQSLGYPVLADTLPDQPGPLAGILAAGARLSGPWLLAVPCDVPFLPPDLVYVLHAHAAAGGHLAVYAAESAQAHYAVMLLRRECLPSLAEYLAAGGRQARAWLASHNAQAVPFPADGAAFLNINTPQDLEHAEHIHRVTCR